MKSLIVIIFTVLAFTNLVCGQKVINPIVSVGSSYMFSIKDGYRGYDFNFGGGFSVNNQWSFQLHANYLRCGMDSDNDNFSALQMINTSLSTSYRFLKKTHRFSPVLDLDFGVNMWSNAKGLYVDDNYIIQEHSDYYHYRFLNYSLFGKTKLLLSINAKSFDFLIGPSFNTYFFNFRYAQKPTYYDLEMGIGLETKVQYTFPMKKQQAKKVVD
jgi:hypothetical protein